MSHPMILPALAAATLLLACKNRKDVTADAPPPAAETTAQDGTMRLGGTALADSLVLSLERTPCFGMCPAYRIHVYRSGHATYEGRVHVEKEGMHTARIGRDTMENILRRAEEIGFFGLNDVYDSNVTDLPSTIIRVVGNGRDKQVTGRVGTPASFRAFAEYVEELLLPVAWKPVPGTH